MNDLFQENKRILFILVAFLGIFAVVLTFLVVRPLMDDLNRAEERVAAEQELANQLQLRLDGLNEEVSDVDIDQLLLEKSVPQERQLDAYILNLQKLEQDSNSYIDRVTFSYDSSIDPLDEGELEEVAEEQVDDDFSDMVEAPTFITEVPKELEVMTVKVIAHVRTYDDIVNLVRGIEDQERISIVHHMRAVIQTEEEKVVDEEEILIALEIDVSTFYYAD